MSLGFSFDASAVVRLRSSHCFIPDAFMTPFPLTRTTTALDRSSLGWFKASPCRAALEGLPPSPLELQHFRELLFFFRASWHTGCVKTILGSRPGQKTRTTVALSGTHYVRTANESTLMHILFLSEEFSHSLCPKATFADWQNQRLLGTIVEY